MKHGKVRASMAHKCRRCITDYLVNGKKEEDEYNGVALMGTIIHEGFVSVYEKIIGNRITDREKSIENEFFTGHIDGYIKKHKMLFELKTVNSFIFAKLEEAKNEHVQQVHVYMNILNLKHAHIVYVDRDTGDNKSFIVNYDPLIYKSIEQKAKECIEDARNGRSGYDINLDAFETCDAYCDFQTAKPIEILPEGEILSEELPNRDEIIGLIQEYQEFNAQEKDANANKAHIAEQVKQMLLSVNAKKIPDLKLGFVQRTVVGVDTEKLKKEHPEIFEQYKKVNVSQYIKFPTAV